MKTVALTLMLLLATWLTPSVASDETIREILTEVADFEAKKYNMSIALAFFQNASSRTIRGTDDGDLVIVAAGHITKPS